MFDDLTPEQRHAATHDGGHLLIVAGAGTGKTTTLAARLAHLVAAGAPPERILLLTFSRRAAAELLGRAERLGGGEVAARAWGGTFHAVAARLLRRYGRAVGIDPSFTVLDAADQADLLALVRDEVGGGDDVPSRRRARKEVMAEIMSRCVNSRSPLSEVLRRAYPWCLDDRDDLRATFVAYTERKRRRMVLDYDDLLLGWHALLADPVAGPLVRSRFDHVLVDEYQDTNALQADILAGLADGGATLSAVGDDAQAIYSFRAATVDNILGFPARFGAEVVTLTESHRSTTPLLGATNALIAEAAERHPKDLWSRRPGGRAPRLLRCGDEGEQSAAVCERILAHHEAGTPLRGQAVLVRTGHHSDVLELELTMRNIPFVKFGGLRFLEAAHVKDLVAALRVVENRRDELAWFRLLLLHDGVGPATARQATAALLEAPDPLAALPPAAQPLAEAVAEAAVAAPSAPAVAVARMRAWLAPFLARRNSAVARGNDLDQLERAAATAPDLARFLTDLTLDPPASTGELAGPPHLDDDVLTVSTIHSAKGGEWDVVHVIHLADGNVPSDMATGDPDQIEEERRLLYVAMTRARDELYLYAPLRYHHRRRGRDDAHGYAQLSRFLSPTVLARCDDEAPRRSAMGSAEAEVAIDGDGDGALAALDREIAALWD